MPCFPTLPVCWRERLASSCQVRRGVLACSTVPVRALAVSPVCRAGWQTESRVYLTWAASIRRWLTEQHRSLPEPPAYAPGCEPGGAEHAPDILFKPLEVEPTPVGRSWGCRTGACSPCARTVERTHSRLTTVAPGVDSGEAVS